MQTTGTGDEKGAWGVAMEQGDPEPGNPEPASSAAC